MQLIHTTTLSAFLLATAHASPSPIYDLTFSLNGRTSTPQYALTYLHHNPKTNTSNILANTSTPHPSTLKVQLHVSDPDDNPDDTGDHTVVLLPPHAGKLQYRCAGYNDTHACFIHVNTVDEVNTDYWWRDADTSVLWNHGNKPTGFFNCEFTLGSGGKVRGLGYGKLRKGEGEGELVPPVGCERTFLYAL